MALPTHLTLDLVTPDRKIAHAEVDEVQIPGSEGSLGVLPGHTPLLTALKVGELWYRVGAEKHYVSVAYGFAEVLPDHVTILARVAERAEEVDIERARAAEKRARERLATPGLVDVDFERVRIDLLKSLSRLQVAEKIRRHGSV